MYRKNEQSADVEYMGDYREQGVGHQKINDVGRARKARVLTSDFRGFRGISGEISPKLTAVADRNKSVVS